MSGARPGLKEQVILQTESTGILPCIKLKREGDFLAYARAMHEGGARVVEITMTTPGALDAIQAISSEFEDELFVAAGTVLDAATAREVIRHGGSLLVNPAVIPEVIELAANNRAPQHLVHYLRDLANDFHTYYNAHTFIVDDAALRNARLALISATRNVIASGLAIIGVSAPESM